MVLLVTRVHKNFSVGNYKPQATSPGTDQKNNYYCIIKTRVGVKGVYKNILVKSRTFLCQIAMGGEESNKIGVEKRF